MPNNLPNNTKGAANARRGANATDNRWTGTNRRISEPADGRLSDRGRDDLPGIEVCKNCGNVHMNDRWYRHDKAPEEASAPDAPRFEVICPGCKQVNDRNPGGILTLSGKFLVEHREEIMNLIRHEEDKATGVNPLEKVMEITEESEDTVIITTTNEFLVQRFGKSVNSAYKGEFELKFGGNDVPVRVNWHRD